MKRNRYLVVLVFAIFFVIMLILFVCGLGLVSVAPLYASR